MKVATNIRTEDWKMIINDLIEDDWQVISKYEGYDAGIDFDFLILKKDSNKITFDWDNWLEGEIKCSDLMFDFLTSRFQINFSYSKPNNLKSSVISLTKTQIFFQKIRKKIFVD